MAFHEFKGWEHGPADATHFSVQGACAPWLKVDNNGVYYAWAWPRKAWEWLKYDDYDDYAERHLIDAIVKHPAVAPLGIEVINGVEVDWGKAPEGTTHALILRDEFHGWRKHTPEVVYRWEEEQWLNSGNTPHIWLDVNKHCIFEHPDVRGVKVQYQEVKPEQPKPAPKKQVGWWR